MKKTCAVVILIILPLIGISASLEDVRLVASEVTICKGSSVDLSKYVEGAPPGTTIVWKAGSTAVGQIVNPSTTTTYNATFTNGAESITRSPFTIKVVQAPVITAISNQNPSICSGQSVVLNASATGYSEIKWYKVNDVKALANNTTVTPTTTITYEVNALPTSEVCSFVASTTTITVATPRDPAISVGGNTNASASQTVTICKGDVLNLNTYFTTTTDVGTLTTNTRMWSQGASQLGANPASITCSTTGSTTYTLTVDAAAGYVQGACGTRTSNKSFTRTLTVNVNDCKPTITNNSGATVCEGTTIRFTINKGNLVFAWSDVSISGSGFDNKTLVSENASSIIFTVRAINSIVNVGASISNIKLAGGGSAPNATIAPIAVNANAVNCEPKFTSPTVQVCPGKAVNLKISGSKYSISQVQVVSAQSKGPADELTPAQARAAAGTAAGSNENYSWSFSVYPGDTTTYKLRILYLVGSAPKTVDQNVTINPTTDCKPKVVYTNRDSICAGFEQEVLISNPNSYTINSVTWSSCGNPQPAIVAGSNFLKWKIAPATSCRYYAHIQYLAGAQTQTVKDSFDVKVRDCKPLLQVDSCPDNTSDCQFNPNPGSGGKDGTIDQTFCSGQKVTFYLHASMGVNKVTNVAWNRPVAIKDTIRNRQENDSIIVYTAQPNTLGAVDYQATITYQNSSTNSVASTVQTYSINVEECMPPVYAQAVWNGGVGNLCRGNEVKFVIPVKYKNNSVVNVTSSEGLERVDVANTDTFTFRALPKPNRDTTLNYTFTIQYNTNSGEPDQFGDRHESITMQTCTPVIAPPTGQCEGSEVFFAVEKKNLVFSRDSITFSGSANSFAPKYNNVDNDGQVDYKIMAHNAANNITAQIRLANGEKIPVGFSVDGVRCEPFFTAPNDEKCPKTDVEIDVSKGLPTHTINNVKWQESDPVRVTDEKYTVNIAQTYTFHGEIFYSYTDGEQVVHTSADKEATVKIMRQVFRCDDTTICRGGVVNINLLKKEGVEIPSYIDTIKSPVFTESYTIPARVADCVSHTVKTIEESITIAVDTAVWVASMQDTVMCMGDSISLSATGIGRFSWFSVDSSEVYKNARPRIAPKSTTDYVVTVKNACGPKFDTARVTVKVAPGAPAAIYGVHAPLANYYYTYFVEANPVVDYYTWTYPAGWEKDSQSGDSIRFKFSDTQGELKVTAHNVCGSASYADLIAVRKGFDIILKPNPTSDFLYLQARSCLMERIAVYNMSMQPMLPIVVFSYPQNEFTMNVSDLYPGSYFLFVWIDQQKKPLTYKFVKKDK